MLSLASVTLPAERKRVSDGIWPAGTGGLNATNKNVYALLDENPSFEGNWVKGCLERYRIVNSGNTRFVG